MLFPEYTNTQIFEFYLPMKNNKENYTKIDLRRICWRHPRFLRKIPWNKLVIIPMIVLIYQYILAQRAADELRLKLQENMRSKWYIYYVVMFSILLLNNF